VGASSNTEGVDDVLRAVKVDGVEDIEGAGELVRVVVVVSHEGEVVPAGVVGSERVVFVVLMRCVVAGVVGVVY
jgi:hypothetical protein